MAIYRYKIMLVLIGIALLPGCQSETNYGDQKEDSNKNRKLGVLLVSHGSHSEKWREMLFDVEDSVRSSVLANQHIDGIKSAYMEYNEPMIATRMKEFDAEGYTDVIVIPMFLTVSGHTFDDISVILGLTDDKAKADELKLEGIFTYKARVNTVVTPLLDFPGVLRNNVVRRVENLSDNPDEEGLVLVAYGDKTYNKEWTALLADIADVVEKRVGINKYEYSWCGHIVSYDTKPTTDAIENILKEKNIAITIPVLVAFDEMFQVDIIGGAIKKVKGEKERVKYVPDAILPDQNIQQWVIDISVKTANEIISEEAGYNEVAKAK